MRFLIFLVLFVTLFVTNCLFERWNKWLFCRKPDLVLVSFQFSVLKQIAKQIRHHFFLCIFAQLCGKCSTIWIGIFFNINYLSQYCLKKQEPGSKVFNFMVSRWVTEDYNGLGGSTIRKYSVITKHRKNCECCPVSLLIVR